MQQKMQLHPTTWDSAHEDGLISHSQAKLASTRCKEPGAATMPSFSIQFLLSACTIWNLSHWKYSTAMRPMDDCKYSNAGMVNQKP